jgi:hypothetical protein
VPSPPQVEHIAVPWQPWQNRFPGSWPEPLHKGQIPLPRQLWQMARPGCSACAPPVDSTLRSHRGRAGEASSGEPGPAGLAAPRPPTLAGPGGTGPPARAGTTRRRVGRPNAGMAALASEGVAAGELRNRKRGSRILGAAEVSAGGAGVSADVGLTGSASGDGLREPAGAAEALLDRWAVSCS